MFDGRGVRMPDPRWPADRRAPSRLEEVRTFVNTENRQNGGDLLGSADEVVRWLASRGTNVEHVRDRDLRTIHSLRSLLRALAITNAGPNGDDAAGVRPSDSWAALTHIASTHPLTIDFAGPTALIPATGAAPAWIADLLQIVLMARLDGSWQRLKACGDPTCRWIVYDRSKNASVSWCSASGCGAKARSRDYRRRHRPAALSHAAAERPSGP